MTIAAATLDRFEGDSFSPRIHELPDARGTGTRRGETTLGGWRIHEDPCGEWSDVRDYPTCSLHGAMNRVGVDPSFWRCLVEGCNVGCEYVEQDAVQEAEDILREEIEAVRFLEDHETPPPDPRNRHFLPPGARSASWGTHGELIDIEWKDGD